MQLCDQLGTLKTTKYRARFYFNYYLNTIRKSGHTFPEENIRLLVCTAIRIAIQSTIPQIMDFLSIQDWIRIGRGQFSEENFVNFTAMLTKTLPNLQISTPYDLFPIKSLIPSINNHDLHITESILGFSMTISELSVVSGEELFWGSIFAGVKKSLKATTYQIIVAIINDEEKLETAVEVSRIIAGTYNQLKKET